uniref:KIB1-4 beta-propeller domain-containing protein n=1 Tax=Oryza barthii TaxID=65489 RepID=A0A0D3GM40_9ORYZ
MPAASDLGRDVVVVPPAGVMDDDDESTWSPWPDLQPELAGMVFCRLLSHGDRLRFRAVCRRWRLAARQQYPLPPALPWLNLDGRVTYQSLPDGEVHRIPVPDETVVCRGSFDGGWLLYDRSEQLECFLMNPISKARIDLPYHWHCDDDDDDAILPDYGEEEEGQRTMCFGENAVRKIAVCSPDLVAAVIAGSGVFFYRPGMHSTWLFASGGPGFARDIAYYNGKLYSVSSDGELFVHEFSDSISADIVIGIAPQAYSCQGYSWRSTFYLVISCTTGRLMMVRWRWHLPIFYNVRRWGVDELRKEIKLDVFEADLEKRRWLEVKELGDQALFLGTSCSRAILSSDYGSCIFFSSLNITRLCSDGIINGIGDCAYCVYDMKNDSFRFDNPVSIKREGLSYGSDGRWRADWFFPCE